MTPINQLNMPNTHPMNNQMNKNNPMKAPSNDYGGMYDMPSIDEHNKNTLIRNNLLRAPENEKDNEDEKDNEETWISRVNK